MRRSRRKRDPNANIDWGDCDDRTREQLLALSGRSGLSVVEVLKLVHEVVMAERDPLPLDEQGDWFDFDAQRKDASEPFEVADLWFINPVVPPPNAWVDLDRARHEFKKDMERCKDLLEHHAAELGLEMLCAIHRNCLGWTRFWAVRHSDPEMRARLAQEIEDSKPGRAKMRALAEKLIREQGYPEVLQ